MKRTGSLTLLFLILFAWDEHAWSQFSRYIVRLKHKGGSTYTLSNPGAFLSARALQRRTRYSLLLDSTDLPVSTSQMNQLRAIPNLTILHTSKWLNAVSIQTSDANAINSIQALPFVQSVSGIAARVGPEPARDKWEQSSPLAIDPYTDRISADHYNYGSGSLAEIRLHQGEFLHNIGLRGQGMQIALLDGGFYNYTSLKAFDSVNTNGQIISTWDFVSGNSSVSEDHPHGMQCLSTIAANIPGQFIGKAPKASFHLFRTEDVSTEFPIEEFNWVCGAERADSAGADLISSSVGYYDFENATFNYSYSQLNGNTTLSAIGADLGAKKGLLIVNSAGNEGGNSWKYIITPADADSILCVGAVNASGVVGAFSSYGPSADGQTKPDVASVGVSALIQGSGNTVVTGNGTSFACPNMAGLAACLWQGFPEFSNMQIIQTLRESSDRYTNPDDRTGYGIPNLKTAVGKLLTSFTTSSATVNTCQVIIQWTSKDLASMRYEIDRKAPGDLAFVKIAEVAAKPGEILSTQSYQISHVLSNVSAGNIQFRIRQIMDTTTAGFTAVYIDTTNVQLPITCFTTGFPNPNDPELKLSIVPNPSGRDQAELILEGERSLGILQIQITDAQGRMIRRLTSNKRPGRQSIPLQNTGLSTGQYWIQVNQSGRRIGSIQWMLLR